MSIDPKYTNACTTLCISVTDECTEELLKKQYRRRALQCHPDKNPSQTATEEFRKITDAYDYLMTNLGYADLDSDEVDEILNESNQPNQNARGGKYQDILFSFLTPILQSETFQDIKSKIFFSVVEFISAKYEPKAIALLEKLDKKIFAKIYDLLKAHRDILYISEEFLQKVEQSFSKKTQNDGCIILNPIIDDLFENNLYRLNQDGEIYIIPLWHHELIYDHLGGELYVQCVPILTDAIKLDENNNIHVKIEASIDDVWTKDGIIVDLGKKTFFISKNKLKMTQNQIIQIIGVGISQINVNDIYDVTKKGDIYAHITLYK